MRVHTKNSLKRVQGQKSLDVCKKKDPPVQSGFTRAKFILSLCLEFLFRFQFMLFGVKHMSHHLLVSQPLKPVLLLWRERSHQESVLESSPFCGDY